MPSSESLRLTALLTPTLGDWLYWPADHCAAGHENTDSLYAVGEVCAECLMAALDRELPLLASDPAWWERLEARHARQGELKVAPHPALVIGRGTPKDLDDPGTFWAAFGRYIQTNPPVLFSLGDPDAAAILAWVVVRVGELDHNDPTAALRRTWLAALERLAGKEDADGE